MYINEVIRECDILCPNEYSDEEKYMWCDELSATIEQEYLKKYDSVTLKPDTDGTYLLPEGVTFEAVDRIIAGKTEIDKLDFRSYGIKYLYGRRGRFLLPARTRLGKRNIEVVYLKRHEPIRSGTIECKATFQSGGFFVRYEDIDGIRIGDTVNIELKADTLSDDEPFECDGDEFGAVPIMNIEGMDESECFVTVPDNTFSGLFSGSEYEETRTCHITRIVTDETVCDAPYDRMYVDYVNAQICYYQRDFDTYNQHMNLFNQRLAAYRSWLQERRTQDRDGRIINWW